MTSPEDTFAAVEPARAAPPWRTRLPSLSIATLGCLIALAAFLHLYASQAQSESRAFQRIVDRVTSRVAEITRRYEYGL